MRSVESEISGLPYELARRFVESCSSRVEFGAYDGATSASEVDQAFVAECCVRTKNRVEIDVDRLGESASGRQAVTWSDLTADDRATNPGCNLLREWSCGGVIYSDQHVCILCKQCAV